jgi:arylsulfatase A-like enzyme
MCLNRALDDSVGAIREALEDTGELDRTIFIYHSDNGFFLGEHGLSAKYYPYEEALRVPLIIRYPREISPGLRLDAPVYTLDLAPSILEWAGVPTPRAMQGRSLSPLLRSEGYSPWREATLHEYFHHQGDVPPVLWLSARTKRWVYSRFARPFDEELYDLKEDPYQMKNLVHSANHEGQLSEMRHLLDRLVTETGGDAIPVPA